MDSSFTDLNTSDIEPMEPNRPPSATSSRSRLSSPSNHSGPGHLARTIAEMHPNRPLVTEEERLAALARRLDLDLDGGVPDPSWVPHAAPAQDGKSMPLLRYRISPREDVSWEVLERFTERLRFETDPHELEMWDLPGMQTIYYWDVELRPTQVMLYQEDPAVEGIEEIASHDDHSNSIEDAEADWEDDDDDEVDMEKPGSRKQATDNNSSLRQ